MPNNEKDNNQENLENDAVINDVTLEEGKSQDTTSEIPSNKTDKTENKTETKSGKVAAIIVLTIIALMAIGVSVGLYWSKKPAPQQLQGVVDADEVNVATKTLSRVEKLMVEEGQMVNQGDLLAVLSNPEAQSLQKQADATLQSALAQSDLVNSGDRPEDTATVYAAWKAASATAELARKTATRSDNLLAQGVISKQRADEARAARDATAMQAEAMHQQYLKSKAGNRSQSKTIAQNQIKVAKASQEAAQALNKETMLYAPISGEVSHKLVMAGEIVAPALPVYQITNMSDMHITINVREDNYKGMQIGKILHGDIPALGQKNIPFKVTYISPQADFATWRATRQSSGYDIRTFEVKLAPQNQNSGLRPGMSVLFNWPQ